MMVRQTTILFATSRTGSTPCWWAASTSTPGRRPIVSFTRRRAYQNVPLARLDASGAGFVDIGFGFSWNQVFENCRMHLMDYLHDLERVIDNFTGSGTVVSSVSVTSNDLDKLEIFWSCWNFFSNQSVSSVKFNPVDYFGPEIDHTPFSTIKPSGTNLTPKMQPNTAMNPEPVVVNAPQLPLVDVDRMRNRFQNQEARRDQFRGPSPDSLSRVRWNPTGNEQPKPPMQPPPPPSIPNMVFTRSPFLDQPKVQPQPPLLQPRRFEVQEENHNPDEVGRLWCFKLHI